MASYSNAVLKLNRQLVKAATAGDVSAMEKLLDGGADVDFYEEHFFGMDKTPLLCAARRGHADAVKCLIERGASIDFQDRNLYTALMYAANYGHHGAVEALLDAGADITLRSVRGNSARQFAAENGKHGVVKLLDAYKAGRWPKKPPEKKAPAKKLAPVAVESVEADEIVFERPFLGNRLLQEVFNFSALERITVIRKDADSAVESMTREPFSAIESQSILREAFAEHVRRGGKTREEEVFGHTTLPKHKFPPHVG